MRDNEGLRSLLQTLGSAVVGIGLGLAVLGAGVFVSRLTLGSSVTVARTSAPLATVSGTPSAIAATAAATVAPTVEPTVAPTPAPTETPAPTPTKDPLTIQAYSNGGRRFAAFVLAAVPYTVTSPVAGTITLARYQFIDGEVRVGSNFPGVSFFPYITITSADRKIVMRPAALDEGVKLMVTDGQRVAAGDALFSIGSLAPSSWRTFYDRTLQAQVIASVATTGGAEVDPLPIFRR